MMINQKRERHHADRQNHHSKNKSDNVANDQQGPAFAGAKNCRHEGFVFAVVVLSISVVSFPLLIDHHVSLGTAVRTSVKAVMVNPVTMLAWGAIVGLSLFIGSLPFFVGLAVVFPVLGHATWHLYRKVVEF